jgi:hypothetical protein
MGASRPARDRRGERVGPPNCVVGEGLRSRAFYSASPSALSLATTTPLPTPMNRPRILF